MNQRNLISYQVNGRRVESSGKYILDKVAKTNLSDLDIIFTPREDREERRKNDAVLIGYMPEGNMIFEIIGIFLNPLGRVCFSNWPSEEKLKQMPLTKLGDLQVTKISELKGHLEAKLGEYDNSCQDLIPSMYIHQRAQWSQRIPEIFLPLFLPTPYLLEQLEIFFISS